MTLRILTSGNGRMELLPTDMGKTVEAGCGGGWVEGKSSVLNILSLR